MYVIAVKHSTSPGHPQVPMGRAVGTPAGNATRESESSVPTDPPQIR